MEKINLKINRKYETENLGLLDFYHKGYGIGSVEYIVDNKIDNRYTCINDIFLPTVSDKEITYSDDILYDSGSGNVHYMPEIVDVAKNISESFIKFYEIQLSEINSDSCIPKRKNNSWERNGKVKIFNGLPKYIGYQDNLFGFIKYKTEDGVEYQVTPFRFAKDRNGFVSCRYHSLQFIRYIEGQSINYYPQTLDDNDKTDYEYEINPTIHYYNPNIDFYDVDGNVNRDEIVEQLKIFIIYCESVLEAKKEQ